MKKTIMLCCLLWWIAAPQLFAQSEIELLDSYVVIEDAKKLTELGKYDAAIEKFNKIPVNDTNYDRASFEYAYCLYAAKRYTQAINLAREAIKKEEYNTYLFYLLLGNSLDDNHQSEEALLVYDEGIRKYPNIHLMHYNKGMTLYNMERYEDAMVELKKCLAMYRHHVRSHFIIGKINALYGRPVQAMLCYNMAAILQNDQGIAKDCISEMEKIVNNTHETVSGKLRAFEDETESYDDIQTLLESGIAMNDKFKCKAKLNFSVVKQIQVLFESLKYDPSSKDFYMQTYIKFFADLNNKGYLVPYSYYILASFDIPKVKAYLEKSKATVDKFANWAGTTLSEPAKYKDGTRVNYHNNQVVSSFGNYADKTEKLEDGPWSFFFTNGNKKSEGSFVSGKKTGTWTYYFYNGNIRVIENYKDGKHEGLHQEFYESGKKELEYTMSNDQLQGKFTRFYQDGQVKESGEWNMGKQIGQQTFYFNNGVVRTALNFVDGMREGYNKVCYPSGQVRTEATYLKGEFNGDLKEYYENGKVKEEFTYKNGKPVGPFKTYYYNGQVETEGTYGENGQRTGLVKDYYFNGQLSSEEQMLNDNLEGVCNYYDSDGILYSVLVFKNKRVVQMKYLNKTGGIISDVEVPKGKQLIKTYHPEGVLAGEGSYYDNALQGKWKYYNRNGVLESEKEYKAGNLDGEIRYYHPNGQLESVYTISNGDWNGYYKSYFINGKIESEGWYVNDERQGIWKNYFVNGKMESMDYYLNDELYGPQQSFKYNGELYIVEYWDDAVFNGSEKYDSTAKIWASSFLSEGSGDYRLTTVDGRVLETSTYVNGSRVDSLRSYYYANGKRRVTGFFVNGRREGKFSWYFSHGSVDTETEYLNGRKNGYGRTYHSSGVIETQSIYDYGEDNGIYTRYYPSGKVRIESKYVDGDREGLRKFYSNEGTEMYQMMYTEDNLLYITWLDKNGKEVPPIYLGTDSVHIVTKYPSGQVSAEFSIKAGLLHGNYKDYYPNGKLQTEATYYYGKNNGIFRHYFSNGKIWQEEPYFFSDLNGLCKEYYENGQLRSEENKEGDDLHGYARYYNTQGKLIREAYYYYDELISEKIY